MTVKDSNKKKSDNDAKIKDIEKKSSIKKKGIPNSGTNVFFREPLDKKKVSYTKPTSKDNYWKQGNLFDLGESIKNLDDISKIDLEKVKSKKSLNKKASTKVSGTKAKIDNSKKVNGSKSKIANPKKGVDSTRSKKAIEKDKPTKATTKKKVDSKKSTLKSKATNTKSSVVKKVSVNSKSSKKTLKSNNSTKEVIPKTKRKVPSKNSHSRNSAILKNNVNKVSTTIDKSDNKKGHYLSIFLIIASILLISFIAFLYNSYTTNLNNDKSSVVSQDTRDKLLLTNNSGVLESSYEAKLIEVPQIIKPAINKVVNTIPYEIVIEKGMSAKDVAHLIASSSYQDEEEVLTYFIDNDISKKINIGTYYLIPSMSLSDIADKITIKDNFTMTIYPGMTLTQIDSILSQRNLCDVGDFINECTLICDEYGLSFVEGWFYPGKYEVNRDFNVRELCLNMYYAMLNALSPLLDDIAKSNYSIEQTLIIASLIQAETNNINQMPLISEIIHNRLDLDMPLGINATTCYELGVYKSDIDQSVYDKITPYNTRRKKGLVPSAISTVSLDALKAAVYPSVGEYLYYNHTKDGEMFVAKTYEKHLKNIEGNK